MGIVEDIKSWSRRQGAPVTVGLMVTMIATNLYFWFSQGKGIEHLAFRSGETGQFWTFATYPWAFLMIAGWSIVFFVFLMMWLWWVGSATERDIGSYKLLAWWFVWTVVGAVCVLVGASIYKTSVPLLGPEIPISSMTIAWCARNPNVQIRLYGILPLTGKWLGWLTLAAVVFGFGFGAPFIGVLAAVPLGLAFLFATNRLPRLPYERGAVSSRQRTMDKEATTRGQVRYDDTYFDDVRRREQEREERDRLRKLFGDDS